MKAMQPSRGSAPTSKFFRIGVGLLVMWVAGCVAGAGLLVYESASINRSGGWGWILYLGIFLAATAVVSMACALAMAASLWKGEAHRRASTAILIGSGLIGVWLGSGLVLFGMNLSRQYEEEARISKVPPELLAEALRRTALPDSVVSHFRNAEIILKPRARDDNHEAEYILVGGDVDPRCEVVTRFVVFPSGTTVEAMRSHLSMVSVPSELNEQAGVAMFYPFARGTSSSKRDCREWPAKSNVIIERFRAAFRSYRSPAGDMPNRNE